MVEWSPPLRCPLDIKELAVDGRFIGMLRAAAASIEPLLFDAECGVLVLMMELTRHGLES